MIRSLVRLLLLPPLLAIVLVMAFIWTVLDWAICQRPWGDAWRDNWTQYAPLKKEKRS